MTSEGRLDRIEEIIEKQNAGIRDLVIVSRTVLTSIQDVVTSIEEIRDRNKEMAERHEKDHQHMMAEIDKLRASQAETDEKLNVLVDTVDRIIRNWNRNNNN